MNNLHHLFRLGGSVSLGLAIWLLGGGVLVAAESYETDILRLMTGRELVKISLTGLSGEALSTLKFDLEIAGCTTTSPELAQFQISGTSTDHLDGQVVDTATKAGLLHMVYRDGTLRAQAHAFADEFVDKVLHRKGIAQTKIAFKVANGGNSEIYVADYDGHNAVAVTQDHTIVAAPTWVPGRRALYYTSYRLGNPDIFFHDLQTGARRVVAHYTGLNTSAAVSPNGRRLAMILSKAGSPDLWIGDAEGGNLKRITDTKEDESSPCWSPDGRAILLTSRISGRAALYTIPAEGGTLRRFNTSGAINTTEPDWSPDGQWVVYTAQMGGFQICVTRVSNGATQVLAAGEDPTWAPNSRTVIFTRRARGKRALSLLDVPTKQVKDVAQISGNCSQPSWAK